MSTRTENPTARPAVAGVKGARILIVESRYYADIADALIEGAEREIAKNGAKSERLVVPGAFEIPGAVAMAAAKKGKRYDGYVALGCVLADTRIAGTLYEETVRALMQLGATGLAIGNGSVLAADEGAALDQAQTMDIGGDAARAGISLVTLAQRLGTP